MCQRPWWHDLAYPPDSRRWEENHAICTLSAHGWSVAALARVFGRGERTIRQVVRDPARWGLPPAAEGIHRGGRQGRGDEEPEGPEGVTD